MASPNPRIDMLKAQQQAAQRKRSSSLEHLRGILRDCERFLPGTPERLSSLENMHTLLAAESKKMRGAAHGSPAQTGQSLERFFEEASDAVGSLGLGGGLGTGAYPGMFLEDGVITMEDSYHDEIKEEQEEDGSMTMHDQQPPRMVPQAEPHNTRTSPRLAQNNNNMQMNMGMGGMQMGVNGGLGNVVMNGGLNLQGDFSGLGLGGMMPAMAPMVPPAPPVQTQGLPPRPHNMRRGGGDVVSRAAVDNSDSVPERRLSHKEVEQRRREKAKQYFDELRSLLPSAQDSKFDKNSILQNSIQLIKTLRNEMSAASLHGRNQQDISPLTQEYRTVFNLSRQCMAFAGLDGRIWEANQGFCMLLGHLQEESTQLTILSVTAREDSELSLQQGRRLLAKEMGPSCTYNVRLVKKDTSYVHCTVELTLLERDGVPYCFLFCAHAIA